MEKSDDINHEISKQAMETSDDCNQETSKQAKKKKSPKCKLCGKLFFDTSTLRKHLKFVHERLKDYACDICNKSYIKKQTLSHHIETVHEGKKYECMTCNKAFTTPGNLKIHQLCFIPS